MNPKILSASTQGARTNLTWFVFIFTLSFFFLIVLLFLALFNKALPNGVNWTVWWITTGATIIGMLIGMYHFNRADEILKNLSIYFDNYESMKRAKEEDENMERASEEMEKNIQGGWIKFTERYPEIGDVIHLLQSDGSIYQRSRWSPEKPVKPINVLVKPDDNIHFRETDPWLDYVWEHDHSTHVHIKGFTHWRKTNG